MSSRNFAPVVPPQIDPAAFADTADGTLLRSAWVDGLPVTHLGWDTKPPPGSARIEYAQLQIWRGDTPDPEDHSKWVVAGPKLEINGATEWPLKLVVSHEVLATEGPMSVRLALQLFTGQPDYSQPVSFVADRTPPQDQAVPAKAAIAPKRITDADLVAGNDVTITVPRYDDKGYAAGDKVSVYWVRFGGTWPPPSAPIFPDAAVPPTGDITFTLAKDTILDGGSGSFVVSYFLTDKAGNYSNFATAENAEVLLGPEASGMLAPAIPLAQNDGADDVLVLADVITGVHVEIPPFQNAAPGDVIKLYWGASVYEFEPTVWPFPDKPLEVAVPNNVMLVEYGSATDKVEIVVGYEVLRGGLLMGTRQETTIQVNFFVDGPVDPIPGWPDPINEGLALAKLIPGNPASPENALTPEHKGQDARLEVERVDGMVEGQKLRFYWSNLDPQAAPEQFIVDTTVPAPPGDGEPTPQIISVTVRWATIEARGNGAWQLYYQLVTPDSGNFWQSQGQRVTITAMDLPKLACPDAHPTTHYLICDSLVDVAQQDEDEDGKPIVIKAIRIQVPDLSHYLKAGGVLNLKWQALRSDKKPVAEGLYETSLTLDDTNPPTGFIWEVPYYPYISGIYAAALPEDAHAGLGFIEGTFDALGMSWTLKRKKDDPSNPTEQEEQLVAMAMADGPCNINVTAQK